MSAEMQALLDELKKTNEEFKSYAERSDKSLKEHGTVSAETRAALDKANEEIAKLKQEYDELRIASKRPANAESGAVDPEKDLQHRAYEKFLRYGFGETGRAAMTPDEVRILSASSDADGGFTAPDDWEGGIIMNAYDAAELRPICNVGMTGRDAVMMPALTKPSVAWGRVNVAVTAQDIDAGSERMPINDLKALALIHNNTLDDAEADIWTELSVAFADAVAEAEDDAFAVGAGDDSPQGVVADTRVQALYNATGVAAALSDATNNGIDALITLMHAVKKIYRRNSTWAMNSTTEGVIRTLKNGEGDYQWQPPVQAGNPATLLGRPIVNPEGMPDIAAGAFPVAFGDFRSGYRIRDRSGLVIQRLVERYAEYDQTGFLLKRRVGGQVVKAEAFRCLKVAAS